MATQQPSDAALHASSACSGWPSSSFPGGGYVNESTSIGASPKRGAERAPAARRNRRCGGTRPITLKPNAGRWENGTLNLGGIVALGASLELLLEIGIDNIAAALLRKRALLVCALKNKGYTALHADVDVAVFDY